MAWTVARSVSRTAKERLRRLAAGRSDVQVLAVFERACDLVTSDGGVVALVIPEIGNGPLNVVVDGAAGIFDGIESGALVMVDGTRLEVGGLRVELEQTVIWEPRPDWEALRNRHAAIVSRMQLLHSLCLQIENVHHHASTGSLLSLLGDFSQPMAVQFSHRTLEPPSRGRPMQQYTVFRKGVRLQDAPGTGAESVGKLELHNPIPPPTDVVLSTAQAAAETLQRGWMDDVEQLREGAVGLAGLGSGLTPAGDDFLTGVMLWVWLAHPTPLSVCKTLADAAIPRTMTLSAAFLRAAAQGECNTAWHALLAALDEGGDARITAAAQNVLAHGATSGADSLAGFLYFTRDIESL
ncbi:MAG: DUF2877 domain-containing protein [Chloroflexi bacterium]|nr:DUF2877 domain-containing protein [Chloroflexota bacterium]